MNSSQKILVISLVILSATASFVGHHNHHHHSNETNATTIENNSTNSTGSFSADPDMYKTFEQLANQNGFLYEEHEVTTEDGYILKLFRIPGEISEVSPNGKKVAFFQHGILDSADCWVAHHASVAPAFVASRAGYDVWLGNSRGNKYSHSHTNPKISNKDYWSFSFEKMGEHDLPTVITYVLKVTGQPNLAYIGHSQGTSQMFSGLALNEDFFADKVSIFIALGPVMQLTHCKSSLLWFVAENDGLLIDTCSLLGIYEFFPADWLISGGMRLLCGTVPALCKFGTYLIVDEDTTLDDQDRLDVYLGHFPSGTSLNCLLHYAQIIQTKQFQRYDYGKTENQKLYGQDKPPLIHIENISKVPIAMLVGKSDELATDIDNEWAEGQMKNAVKFYKEYPIGHLSFMVAKDMSYMTTDVLNILHQYHPSNELETLFE